MRLTYLKISNFRNLCGQEIYLNPVHNFIVGENNLGKSNLLFLLNTLFRNTYKTGFQAEDFADVNRPIEVIFSLLLDDIEIGLFEDLFDSDSPENNITIRANQPNADEYLEYWHDETNQKISPAVIKCINYLYYDSQRDPLKELTFDKSKGVGKFLNHLVKEHLKKNEETDFDFLDFAKASGLIEEVNNVLCKIKAFKDYGINAQLEEDIENLLSKLFLLKDTEGRHLHQSGYGVQFMAIISLFIYEKLLNIGKLKLRKGVFGDDENRTISIVIGLDEPEIHLHPYLQRSLVKYVQRILNNQEVDFTTVLKSAFNIDFFIGQSMIATHSPSILLSDYTQIIRLYKKDGALNIKSGINISLHHGLKKQLQMQFPFIKEAFFSRCVIVVEGESEVSSFPIFAQKINPEQDFDELGISVIKAGGEKSVQPILDLLEKFDIPALGIIDKDLDTGNKYPNVRKTNEQDFEAEIIKLLDNNKEDTLKSVLLAYDSKGIERELMKEALLARVTDYSSIIDQTLNINSNVKLSEIPEANNALKKLWYITWLSINKNILLGATIGECLSKEDIPQPYVDVIKEAIELSKK